MAKHHMQGKQFLLGAMLGSTIGAISAIMFTTKKGHQFQKNAMEKLHDFEGYVRDLVKHHKQKVVKTVKKIHRTTRRKKAR